MWTCLIGTPVWYDVLCITTSMVVFLVGSAFSAHKSWSLGLIFMLCGLASIMHRSCRLFASTVHPALFVIDVMSALVAGAVLSKITLMQSCQMSCCSALAVALLMLFSWCTHSPKRSYCMHAMAHVLGCFVLASCFCKY